MIRRVAWGLRSNRKTVFKYSLAVFCIVCCIYGGIKSAAELSACRAAIISDKMLGFGGQHVFKRVIYIIWHSLALLCMAVPYMLHPCLRPFSAAAPSSNGLIKAMSASFSFNI